MLRQMQVPAERPLHLFLCSIFRYVSIWAGDETSQPSQKAGAKSLAPQIFGADFQFPDFFFPVYGYHRSLQLRQLPTLEGVSEPFSPRSPHVTESVKLIRVSFAYPEHGERRYSIDFRRRMSNRGGRNDDPHSP